MRTIDQMHEFVATNARRVYNRDHHHVPMFIIDFKKPTDFLGKGMTDIAIMAFKWETEQDREKMSISMRALCHLGIVQNIAFVHEVWAVMGKVGEVDTSVPPSENPERISVLFVSVESADGDSRRGFWRIINPDTKKATLGKYEAQPMDGMAGRFANMFGRRISIEEGIAEATREKRMS